jgi:hypothetical protein
MTEVARKSGGGGPDDIPLDAKAGSVDTTRCDAYTRASKWSRPY